MVLFIRLGVVVSNQKDDGHLPVAIILKILLVGPTQMKPTGKYSDQNEATASIKNKNIRKHMEDKYDVTCCANLSPRQFFFSG